MLINREENHRHGRFFIRQDGKDLAEMRYRMETPAKMVIEHTEVDDSLKGKGIGLQLVSKAVDYARESNIKIIPLCSFAGAVFQKKPEFNDVLA
jgi:predicted GNAT family acetyltransferase